MEIREKSVWMGKNDQYSQGSEAAWTEPGWPNEAAGGLCGRQDFSRD